MKIGWLLGWAVPEGWFAALAREALPEAVHVCVEASPEALDRLESCAPFDWVAGYSLGTQLLLGNPGRVERMLARAIHEPRANLSQSAGHKCFQSPCDVLKGAPRSEARGPPPWPSSGPNRVALLAPIFAFPSEEKLGGRIARAEVRILQRRMRGDPARPLAEFYRRAGLPNLVGRTGGEGPMSRQPNSTRENETNSADGTLGWGLSQLESARVEPPLPDGWIGWCGTDDALLDADRLHALDPGILPLSGATHHPEALIGRLAAAIGKESELRRSGA